MSFLSMSQPLPTLYHPSWSNPLRILLLKASQAASVRVSQPVTLLRTRLGLSGNRGGQLPKAGSVATQPYGFTMVASEALHGTPVADF